MNISSNEHVQELLSAQDNPDESGKCGSFPLELTSQAFHTFI